MSRSPIDIGRTSGTGPLSGAGTQGATVPVGQLRPFGYGRLIEKLPVELGLRGRIGPRPTFVVLAPVYSGRPMAHAEAYYENFFFNQNDPESFAFVMNAYGAAPIRFHPFAPLKFSLSDTEAALDMPARAALLMGKFRGFENNSAYRFAEIDRAARADGVLTDGELLVIIVDNYSADNAATRRFAVDFPDIKFNLQASFNGDQSSLMTFCHEVFHQWGAVDLYGDDGRSNAMLTPMAGTRIGLDDRRMVELDPWHRMQFGLTAPTIIDFATQTSGRISIPSVAKNREDSALLFWDSRQGKDAYFLVELREPTPGAVDRDVPDGIAVWAVQTDQNGNPASVGDGIPGVAAIGKDHGAGSSALWGAGDKTPILNWRGGIWSSLRLAFERPERGTAVISWSTEAIRPPPHDVPKNLYFRSPILAGQNGHSLRAERES